MLNRMMKHEFDPHGHQRRRINLISIREAVSAGTEAGGAVVRGRQCHMAAAGALSA